MGMGILSLKALPCLRQTLRRTKALDTRLVASLRTDGIKRLWLLLSASVA
jgi:hypothetical protein